MIPERFERSTHSLEGCCSIQLSYGTPLTGAKIRFNSFISKRVGIYPKNHPHRILFDCVLNLSDFASERLTLWLGIFGQFTFRSHFVAVMLIMLTLIQADPFAGNGDAHRNHLVGQPIQGISDNKSVDKYDHYSQEVCKKTLPMGHAAAIVNKHTGQNGSDDTADTVRRKDIQCIVEG